MNRLWLGALLLSLSFSTLAQEKNVAYFQADRLEYQSADEAYVWDLQGWYGKDLQKFWWKIEGSDGAASRLALHPSTLRNKMKKLGIVRPR